MMLTNEIVSILVLNCKKILFYVYLQNQVLFSNVEFHLNYQKNLSFKICIEFDIANVKFHL